MLSETGLKYSEHFFISDATYEDKNNNQVKLVYSGRSGKLVFLSIEQYAFISQKQVPPPESDLYKKLLQAEILVDSAQSDLASIIARNNQARTHLSTLYFVILPSTFCNMGCTYCGQTHKKGGLNDQLAEKIIKRISSAVQKSQPKSLHIGWFGGEPLVGYSRMLTLSDALVAIAKGAGIKYGAKIVTNGSLLTFEKLLELHERCKINEFNITLDGPQKLHDARRILKKGGESFAKIISLVQRALKDERLKRVNFVFRTNIDKDNQAYIEEYLQYMHDAGFAHENVSYDLKPVYPWSNDVSAVEIERKKFAAFEVDLMIKTLELGMKLGYLQRATEVTCAALDPYAEIISSTGKLFSCTEHPLVTAHETNDFIGTLDDEWTGQRPKGRFDDFNLKVLAGEMPCSSCKLLGVCGGSCPKQWEQGYIACPSLKYNLQDRLNITAVKMGYRVVINE